MKNNYWRFIFGILALMVLGSTSATAQPVLDQAYAISVEVQGQGTIQVTPDPGSGPSNFPPDATVFYHSSSSQGIDLQWAANPAAGWIFNHWELGLSSDVTTSIANPVTLSLIPGNTNPSDWTVRAVFVEILICTVQVSADPTAGGTVIGGGTYASGTSVIVTATANAGYTFVNWTEDGTIVSTDSSYLFTATADRTLVANFSQVTYTIDVSATPIAGGTVTGGGTHASGASVTVMATANAGYTFVNWTEDGTIVSTNSPFSFTATADRTLVANFSQITYTIDVSANPTAGGTVTGDGTYASGASVTVTASANAGYTFTNWTEDGTIVSTNSSYSFTATADRTLVANFSQVTYTIDVSANPAAGGTVTGDGTYAQGASVTVTASANAGYTFVNWTENGTIVSTNSSYTFAATADRTLVANFTGGPTHTITVSANPTAGGTVTGGGTYAAGASVTVTASANAGYTFVNWTEYGTIVSTISSYTFAATADRTLVGNFTQGTPPPPPVGPFQDDVEQGINGWTAEPLWHITDTRSHSPTHSWWFGDEQTGTYASGEYGTQGVLARQSADTAPKAAGGRAQGTLTSGPISVNGWGETGTLSFWHWRHVEYYPDGAYDRTYVQVRFLDEVWQTVWSQDSRDVSQQSWERVGVAIQIPPRVTSMWVRFVFDSVDGLDNDYPGWFIDDIEAGPPETGTVITVCPLVDGTVGQPYGPVLLGASGGVAPYTWSWAPAILGLSLDQRTGTISGTPTTPGTFSVTITVVDSVGETDTLMCSLVIYSDRPYCVLLPLENFNDATEWTMTGLWHVEFGLDCVACASLMDKYAYFGRNSVCSYATGSRVLGELQSPMIEIPDCVETIVIEFDQFRHVEYYPEAYDRTWFEVSFDGATWETLWYKDASFISPECEHVQVARAVPAGATQMWIRFRFDSVDQFYNDYPGWAIDNVEVLNADCVAGAPSPASLVVVPKAAPRDQISVTNSPNPITDVHTTVFTVRGVNVEAMKIQIFDLSGALVYEEEVAGNELVWHTDSNYGEYLANGVYLYRALVKVGGSWITTSTQKLVILR